MFRHDYLMVLWHWLFLSLFQMLELKYWILCGYFFWCFIPVKSQAIVVVLLKFRNTGSTGAEWLLMTHLCSIIITDNNRIASNSVICRFKWALALHTWILNGSSLLQSPTPNTIIALWNSSATCSRQRSRNLQGFGQAALKVLQCFVKGWQNL